MLCLLFGLDFICLRATGAGIGTCRDGRSPPGRIATVTGCRGIVGPVPPPLWMKPRSKNQFGFDRIALQS